MTTEISNTQDALEIDESWVRKITRHVLDTHECKAEVSIAFVSSAAISELNKQFLNHDGDTDVLAFPLSEHESGTKKDYLGEVVVCGEKAVEQAAELGNDPHHELALYVIHGVLHLLGYDDKSAAEARKMRDKENEVLQQLGYEGIA